MSFLGENGQQASQVQKDAKGSAEEDSCEQSFACLVGCAWREGTMEFPTVPTLLSTILYVMLIVGSCALWSLNSMVCCGFR